MARFSTSTFGFCVSALLLAASYVPLSACNNVLGLDDLSTCKTNNECVNECSAGAKRCYGDTPQTCDWRGQWIDNEVLCETPQHCQGGTCVVQCSIGDLRCVGSTPQICNAPGVWEQGGTCNCEAGECNVAPSSCKRTTLFCGPDANENCCQSTLIKGGSFSRDNDGVHLANVADFRLDRFEVTVGRFRSFVEKYPDSRPQGFSGQHPLISESGWKTAWDTMLPADRAQLESHIGKSALCQNATWTNTEAENEALPINCVDWYLAFAFCAWDGGRLATEAEWNYAAAGGAEQRVYPWSSPPNTATIDITYAFFQCNVEPPVPSCDVTDILHVGSRSPKGDGRWGQADLAGSLWEWTLDSYATDYPKTCDNCANLDANTTRVSRGGGWRDFEDSVKTANSRTPNPPDTISSVTGFRCARSF